MKTVILAGGFGSRFGEQTKKIPKPMITIGDIPIIHHIMNIYSKFGHKDFYIALGYRSEVIKKYFIDYINLKSDLTIDFKNNKFEIHRKKNLDWKVTLIETGYSSMTGGRLKRLQNYIGDSTFMMTYGDGLSDIDLEALLKFHKKSGRIATLTAVNPLARFGMLSLNKDKVEAFDEKYNTGDNWINGGFFVFNKEIFNYIDCDETILEKETLPNLSKEGQLSAFRHNGFWQCMDSMRDKENLEKIWTSNRIPWL